MEWVETTGKTIDDAKEAALDELGVDEQDAEFEVIDEPRLGLFGRLRAEGRVRARVRPVAPPSKDDRRRRGRNGAKAAGPGSKGPAAKGPRDADGATVEAEDAAPSDPTPVAAKRQGGRRPKAPGAGSSAGRSGDSEAGTDTADGPDGQSPPPSAPTRPEPAAGASAAGAGRRSRAKNHDRDATRGEGNEVEVSLEEQGRVAEEFLQGLVGEFGLTADIAATQADEDTLDLALTGEDLGLLIGPKGVTLLAIQDLTRTVVQRRTGANNGRIHVDISGYRQKRSEALSRFARQVAEEVKSSGNRKALEPMSAPDRKVVHDALTEVEGVSTVSEGEDARRRVVILPSD